MRADGVRTILDTIMAKSWDLSVRGKDHKISIDGSEPGKDVIRVDGRVAARALDADETQRAFVVHGSYYSLRRNGANNFELTPIGTARDAAPAAVVIANDAGENHRWQSIITWALIAIAVTTVLVWAFNATL
jgi:hypothetical protein